MSLPLAPYLPIRTGSVRSAARVFRFQRHTQRSGRSCGICKGENDEKETLIRHFFTAVVFSAVTGCSGFIPPGLIYTNAISPYSVDYHDTKIGSKQ